MAARTPKGIDPHDEAALRAVAGDRKQEVANRIFQAAKNLPEFTGFEDPYDRDLKKAITYMRKAGLPSLKPLLPLLLKLKGQPFSLKNHFPFEPLYRTRLPQSQILVCGRQVSKTLRIGASQRVYLANGRPVCGESLAVGDAVLSVDERQRTTAGVVTSVFRHPGKPCLRVTLRTGGELEIAETHPLYRLTGWTVGGNLRVGDRVAALRVGGQFDRRNVPRTRIILTAYLVGDGSTGVSGNFSVTSGCLAVLDECHSLGWVQRRARTVVHFSQAASSPLVQWMQQDGLWGKYAWEKSLPSWVFDLSRSDAALFLSRLWATDGHIKGNGKPTICYSSTSRTLAYDVKALLTKFGIPSSITQREAGYKKDGKYKRCRDAYIVRVETRDGWQRFLAAIHVPGKPPIALPKTVENNNRDTFPIEVNTWLAELAEATAHKHGDSLRKAGLRRKLKYPPTRQKLMCCLRYFQRVNPAHPRLQDLKNLLNNDALWDEIVAIERLPSSPCWDIEVAAHHNYVVDGVLSHNSTSLAAKGVIFSAAVPFFSTLYVTPLFEMVRRFSHNYVREFIEQSPVRRLFSGTGTMNNVLQRSFKNGSVMYFSFAFLDADRTRGIPADNLVIDECPRIGTMVLTPNGSQPVETFRPGDPVLGFNTQGIIHEDEIVKCSDRGVRDCYRFEFASGEALELTSGSWLATTAGWKRVSTVIADAAAGADAARDDARRRASASNCKSLQANLGVSKQPRLETARLQLPQIPGISLVHERASAKAEESRLRQVVESLCNTIFFRFLPYRLLVSSPQQETRDPGLAQSPDLGGNRLVVHGRRQPAGHDRQLPYARLHGARSDAATPLAEIAGDHSESASHDVTAQRGQAVLDTSPDGGLYVSPDREDPPVYLPGDAVQDCFAFAKSGSGLLLVPRDVPGDHVRQVHDACECASVLPSSNVPAQGSQRPKRDLLDQSGQARAKESQNASALLCRSAEDAKAGAPPCQACQGDQPGEVQSSQDPVSSQAARGPSSGNLGMPALSQGREPGHPGSQNQILPRVPRPGDEGDQGQASTSDHATAPDCQRVADGSLLGLSEASACESALRTQAGSVPPSLSPCTIEQATPESLCGRTLIPAELVSITWTGQHRVFDLETRKHNTFIAGGVGIHNCQDVQYDIIQIVAETLSGSPYGCREISGTPKSLDNTLEKLWSDSSQAEWVIKCHEAGCGHFNIPAVDHDLLDMMGPWHRDISEKIPGIVCAKCRKPLQPRHGRWIHRYRERRWKFAGRHVPQQIMPMHYADHEKWDRLCGKHTGRDGTTITTFLNEVCGESSDIGAKLVTETELKAAAILPWQNKATEAQKAVGTRGRYICRILAVDWGGGGGVTRASKGKSEQKRERTSYTALAVLGMKPDGTVECIWGYRSLRTHDWEWEAKLVLEVMSRFRCTHITHDYAGAGEGRLVLLYQSGLPPTNIINIRYQGFGHNIMNFHRATEDHPRDWYSVDKSRSLVTTCMCIKYGLLRFFKYDYVSADQPGMLHDFLALIEEKVDTRMGSDVYTITRNPNAPDDFAQAVNIGCCTLWWMTKKWPNVAEAAKFRIPASVLRHVSPVGKVDWNDL